MKSAKMVTLTSGSVGALVLLLAASHLSVVKSSPSESEDITLEDFLRVANLAVERSKALGLRAAHSRTRSERAVKAKNNNKLGLRRIQRRPELADLASAAEHSARKRASQRQADREHEFFYVIAPVSEQILPIQSEKLAQGFTGLLPLPGGNYATGLRKLSSSSTTLNGNGHDLMTSSELVGCRTIKTSVELTKDELESASGRVVRRCSGRVQLNACEGSCTSSIQPSVKSASGFTKKCACCNEGAFRRVQVRLDQCRLPETSGPLEQVLAGGGHMDIEVEEPIECKCRACDSLL